MSDRPQPGEVCIHKKTGNTYMVLHRAKMEADQQEVVVYQRHLTPEQIWVRPLGEFLEKFHLEHLMGG